MLMMLTFKIMMILTMLAMFSIAQHVLLQLADITHDKTDRKQTKKKKNLVGRSNYMMDIFFSVANYKGGSLNEILIYWLLFGWLCKS